MRSVEKTAQRGRAKSAISGKKEPETAESNAAKIAGQRTKQRPAPGGAARLRTLHAYRTTTCGALTERPMPASMCGSPAGCIACATMAACCSSTCATITASPNAWSIRTALPSAAAEHVRAEWVIRVDGKVVIRGGRYGQPATCRPARSRCGSARLRCFRRPTSCRCRSSASRTTRRTSRLKYRFLDLRRETIHRNIMKRSAIVSSIRRRMTEAGFFEFQTPILTASSPGRRARFSRAVADASRQVLRAAASAAAVQAAHHDRGLRPLFPDRALLPRRGCARRPLARRVLSARYRDELRHAGGRVPGRRAGAARAVRGVRRRQAGDADVPAHPL